MTTMNEIVDEAMAKLKTSNLTPEQEKALREVIVNAVIAASETTTKTAADVARSHEKLDRKSANRISTDIESSLVALVANLEALR